MIDITSFGDTEPHFVPLTSDERAEIEQELLRLRESLDSLRAMPPINPDAGSRKHEVLRRMRDEEQRLLRLLDAQ